VLGCEEKFLTAALVADALRQHGHVRFRALGSSMFPTFRSGDVLSVDACAADGLEVGEVAVVCDADRLFAHRLVEKQLDRSDPVVVTRGDSHWRSDPPRPASAVVGRVVSIGRNGRVIDAPFVSTVRGRVYGLFVSESTRLARRARRRARAIFAICRSSPQLFQTRAK
jgi:signal peptidase I